MSNGEPAAWPSWAPDPAPDGWLDSLPWPHVLGPYRAVTHDFMVRTNDAATAAWCQELLRALEVDRVEGPLTHHSIIDRGPRRQGRWVAYAGAQRNGLFGQPERCVGLLIWALNQAAVASTPDDCVALHAGAVARDGDVVVLAADSESGKSTLTAGLVRAGWDYLSDELAVVRPAGRQVFAYPKPLQIRRGSQHALASARPSRAAAGTWLVPPDTLGRTAIGPGRLAAVVFPRYDEDAAGTLTAVAPAQAALRLARSSFHLSTRARTVLPGVAGLIRNGVPAWELLAGPDLDVTVRAVEAALAR